jgi:branched-chain amino acid transport system substrate-binding protein
MGWSRPRTRWCHAVTLAAIVGLVFGLSACANQLPKEQLLTDARGGELPTREVRAQAAGPDHGAVAVNGTGAAAAVPAAAPAADGSGVAVQPDSASAAPAVHAAANRPAAGSDSNAGSAKSAGVAAAPQKCATPLSEIAIGTVGAQSGFLGASLGGGVQAIKAWAAETNAKGGLNCHPVKYYVADDGGDPAKNAAQTQEMIDQHHVIAMLFSNDPVASQGGKPILERAHIPTIGNEGAADYFNTSPDFFPIASTGEKLIDSNYATLGQVLTPSQRAHLGVLTCIEAAICSRFGGETGAKYAAANGMNLVFNAGSTMVQPDYTSNCQSAKNAGVEALFVVGEAGMLSRTIRSCSKISFRPVYASSPIGLSPEAADIPELEGVILGSTVKPWTITSDPQVQRFRSALTKWIPGAVPGGSTAAGWASALVFEHAGQNLPANPTSANIYAGLWTMKKQDFGGFTVPLTYAKDKPATYPTCWWPMVIHNRAWASTNNGVRGCRKD